MLFGRFNPLERIICGPLPRKHSLKDSERHHQNLELTRARQQADSIQERLRAQESQLRERRPELARELGSEQGTPEPDSGSWIWRGISKTRSKLSEGLGLIIKGRQSLDPTILEELEEFLLSADIGPQTTDRLIKGLAEKLRASGPTMPGQLRELLREQVAQVMNRQYSTPRENAGGPTVILFAGVNGSGKTTTIGKLGAMYASQGLKVLLAAGDTFRAAAAEQLAGWSQRSGCALHRAQEGANPSGVIYQAVEKALNESFDVVLCDTAGRLHTKSNLMEELKKIKRVIGKLIEDAPHETYLVLDANNGQNAIHQTRDFNETVGLTGLIVTKLDGTARGGVIVGIANEFELPVRYVGVGEGVEDLRQFDAREFVSSLFG